MSSCPHGVTFPHGVNTPDDTGTKSDPAKERKEESNHLRDLNRVVELSLGAARDGPEAKLKEGGKEPMENEYNKVEGKKKGKNRVWGDAKNENLLL